MSIINTILEKLPFRKKEEPMPIEEPRSLPEDLEQFRVERDSFRPVEEQRAVIPTLEKEEQFQPVRAPEPREERPNPEEKLDMIIQKLETIDTRLKLIEERTKR